MLVVSYQPEFSDERGLWFVDVALDPGTAFWPFVRFAVARHQPSSVGNLHLSPVLRTDFVQLTPPRTATLSRPEAGQARLVVTGPGRRAAQRPVDRGEAGRLHSEGGPDPADAGAARAPGTRGGTDLGWTTDAALNLPVLGVDGTSCRGPGTLDLPVPVPPRLPGQNPDWRVVLEEWELLPADRTRTASCRGARPASSTRTTCRSDPRVGARPRVSAQSHLTLTALGRCHRCVTMNQATEPGAAVHLFRGLADPARLEILQHLALGEHRVVDLVAHLGLAQSTVSAHIAYLRECNLLTARPVGRSTMYSLSPRAELLDLFAATERLLAVTGSHRHP